MDSYADTTSANTQTAAGITDVDRPSKDGRTALMWACRNGHIDVAQRLVTAGADLEAKNNVSVGVIARATHNRGLWRYG